MDEDIEASADAAMSEPRDRDLTIVKDARQLAISGRYEEALRLLERFPTSLADDGRCDLDPWIRAQAIRVVALVKLKRWQEAIPASHFLGELSKGDIVEELSRPLARQLLGLAKLESQRGEFTSAMAFCADVAYLCAERTEPDVVETAIAARQIYGVAEQARARSQESFAGRRVGSDGSSSRLARRRRLREKQQALLRTPSGADHISVLARGKALFELGIALGDAGRHQDALRALSEAATMLETRWSSSIDAAAANLAYATELVMLRRAEEALAIVERVTESGLAFERSPRFLPLLWKLRIQLLGDELGRWDEAATVATHVCQRWEGRSEAEARRATATAMETLARASAKAGRRAEALTQYDQLLEEYVSEADLETQQILSRAVNARATLAKQR